MAVVICLAGRMSNLSCAANLHGKCINYASLCRAKDLHTPSESIQSQKVNQIVKIKQQQQQQQRQQQTDKQANKQTNKQTDAAVPSHVL